MPSSSGSSGCPSDFAAVPTANRLDHIPRKLEPHDLLRVLAVGIDEAAKSDVDSIPAGTECPGLAGYTGGVLVAETTQALEEVRSLDVDSWT